MTKMKDNINLNEEELSKNIDFLLILWVNFPIFRLLITVVWAYALLFYAS